MTIPSSMDNFPSLGGWIANGRRFDKTYMIGSPKHSSGDVAKPMTISKNGNQIGTTFQPGDKK